MLSRENIVDLITSELKLKPSQVHGTLQLLDEGATVPFIARYRKERTGTLDEVGIRAVRDRFTYIREIEERRAVIIRTIEEAGKMTPGLMAKIEAAAVKQELEDLYLPYKPKRKTKGAAAREKGLEPLALALWRQDRDIVPIDMASKFVDPEKGIADAKEALEGAMYIIAEIISDDAAIRKHIRKVTFQKGLLVSRVKKKFKDQKTKFDQYYDYREPIRTIPSHRFLAIMRGEREGVLATALEAPQQEIMDDLYRRFIKDASFSQRAFLEETLDLAYGTTINKSIETELKAETKERADEEAISVFSENLRQLLLAPPAGGRVIMGIDPGLRTGCKVAVVDGTGKFMEHATIYPHPPRNDASRAAEKIAAMAAACSVELISIGNGTASRETESFARDLLKKHGELDCRPVVVSEAGASVYSASDIAREEFPDLDVSIRGAISIARRLQDPLAELVKIDPKSIGVGQYQHDVNQPRLRLALHETVESCVNHVGVDLNTASAALLRYVSGVSETMAKNIVAYRDENGPLRRRSELKKVARFGPKAFEQAAGFLRIRGGENPLDNSAVHPESYGVVKAMAGDLGASLKELVGSEELAGRIDPKRYVTDAVGLPTLGDILAELKKPGRDPRKTFELVKFREDVTEISQLSEGMVLEGVVTNVTNFGAFVDVGVHQDGLVHISQLADRFVRDPKEVVTVGQRVQVKVLGVDLERRRISLSMKGATGG